MTEIGKAVTLAYQLSGRGTCKNLALSQKWRTNVDDRIRLATAMGWEFDDGIEHCVEPMWRTPPILIQRFEDKVGQQSLYSEFVNEDELPDPFTDANDCEAVIEYLNKMNIFVNVVHGAFFDSVTLVEDAEIISTTEGSDWKQGVCELALKVIDHE